MFIACSLLVLFGLGFLIAGYLPARKICRLVESTSWSVLSYLILVFIVGYSAVLLTLYESQPLNRVVMSLAVILFFGGIFVFMVVNNALSSIETLHKLLAAEHHHATHDTLTGLPNRKHFSETVNTLIDEKQPFDLMLFDVVNFKQINDGMSHYCGDQLLIQIGQRILPLITPPNCVARIGGDEFVVLLNHSNDLKSAALATEIHNLFRQPFDIDGFRIVASIVIGLSRFPQHGPSLDKVLNAADLAMYHAKHSGQLLAVFDPGMNQDAAKNLAIAAQLDNAIREQSFEIHYQPILDAQSLSLEGYEALIRWQTRDGEYISPEDFITIAEQSNQITQITRWMLTQVARDIERFAQQGIDLPIHVNLSAKDLLGTKLMEQLTALLSQQPNFSQKVVLEITESVAINRLRQPARLFEKLHKLGFKISLDDFGTGFSSLSLLRDLPVDQIKIDRSFISNIASSKKDFSIVQSAIALAHGLGYSVVAEGINSRQAATLLQSVDCDYLQGFYFQKPQPLAEIIRWSQSYLPLPLHDRNA